MKLAPVVGCMAFAPIPSGKETELFQNCPFLETGVCKGRRVDVRGIIGTG